MAYLSRYKDLVATGNITSNLVTAIQGVFNHTDTLLANVSQLASSNVHGTYIRTVWPSTGRTVWAVGPGPNQFQVNVNYPSPVVIPPFYIGQKIGFSNHVVYTVTNQTNFSGLWTITIDQNYTPTLEPVLYPLDQYANASIHTSGNSFVQLIDATISDRLVIQSGAVTGSVDNMVIGGITAANGYFTEDHANNIYLNHGIYFGEDGTYQNTAFRWANNYTSTLTPNNAIGREHDNWLYTDPTPFQQYVKINNQWAFNQNTSSLSQSISNGVKLGLGDLFDVDIYDTLVETSANNVIHAALNPSSNVSFSVGVDRRNWTVNFTFAGLDTANVNNLISLGRGTYISSNVTTNYQGLGTVSWTTEIVEIEQVSANTVTLHTKVPTSNPEYVSYLADAVSANTDEFTSSGNIASNYFQTGTVLNSPNIANRLIIRNSDNTGWVVGSNVASIGVAGLNGQLQYNNNGVPGGISGVTTDGTSITSNVAHIFLTGGALGQSLVVANSVTGAVGFANVVTSPAGFDSEVQFNKNGTFGSNTLFSYVESQKTLYVGDIAIDAIYNEIRTDSGGKNLRINVEDFGNNLLLPNTAFVKMGGGANGQYLTTDGTGNIAWGNVVTSIETSPYVQFTPSSNATGQIFTDSNISKYQSNTYAIVFKNGVALSPSEYDISGSSLTINNYLTTSDSISVAPIVAGKFNNIVSASGANTQIQFNSNGSLSASANLTFNGVTLTTNNISATNVYASNLDKIGTHLYSRAPQQTIANGTDAAVALYDTIITNNISGLSVSGTSFVYSGATPITVMISYQVSFAANNIGERVTYLAQNNVSAGFNRYAQIQQPAVNGDATTLNGSTILTLSNGDSFTIFAYQTSGGNLIIGGAQGGMASGYSNRLQIAVLR